VHSVSASASSTWILVSDGDQGKYLNPGQACTKGNGFCRRHRQKPLEGHRSWLGEALTEGQDRPQCSTTSQAVADWVRPAQTVRLPHNAERRTPKDTPATSKRPHRQVRAAAQLSSRLRRGDQAWDPQPQHHRHRRPPPRTATQEVLNQRRPDIGHRPTDVRAGVRESLPQTLTNLEVVPALLAVNRQGIEAGAVFCAGQFGRSNADTGIPRRGPQIDPRPGDQPAPALP